MVKISRNYIQKAVFSLILILCNFTLWGKEKTVFFFEPKIELLNGKLDEYLYSSSNDHLLSCLEWQEQFIPVLGLESGFIYNKSSVITEFCYRLPIKCGLMTDSDWKIADTKTNYGIFNNHTDLKNYNFSLTYSYNFAINDQFCFAPYIELNYNHYSFYTDIGYGWYGNTIAWDDPAAVYHPKLSHIEFIMQNYGVFTGLTLNYNQNRFCVAFSAAVSPLMMNYAIDYHGDDNKNGNKDYTTCTKQLCSFLAVKSRLKGEYKITDKTAVTGSFDLFFTGLTKGPTEYITGKTKESPGITTKLKEWNLLAQKSGNRIIEIKFCTGYKILF